MNQRANNQNICEHTVILLLFIIGIPRASHLHRPFGYHSCIKTVLLLTLIELVHSALNSKNIIIHVTLHIKHISYRYILTFNRSTKILHKYENT